MSIERQRAMLQSYVYEHGGVVTEAYADDGFSGTDFDRPAVKRMLEDAKTGVIDTILVKDLSRFGRNYIQVGQYLDYIFPAYGIRFIAVGDNVDTADRNSAAMDMMPIMNVFNEWHAANTSKKIRAVFDAGRRTGKYVSAVYPYGYKAGKDENRTAVIDEEAAAVVRRIFSLRIEGCSTRAIAKRLTDEGIPNPASHFTRLDGKKIDKRFSPYWCAATVAWILKNPIYIGTTVQHKTTGVSYKNHKVLRVPEREQVIRENAHAPIVSRFVWESVQAINRSVSRGKADKAHTLHALSGLLVCADCGKKLKYKASGKRFVCRTYADLGKKYCTSHGISEAEIESVVLSDLQAMAKSIPFDAEKVRERFLRKRARQGKAGRDENEVRLKACKNRRADLDKLIASAFEERVLGRLPEDMCARLCDAYGRERAAVEEEIAALEKKVAVIDGKDRAEEYVCKVRAYASCAQLTRELCMQLIRFITVGEKSDGGERSIHIYYNLRGE